MFFPLPIYSSHWAHITGHLLCARHSRAVDEGFQTGTGLKLEPPTFFFFSWRRLSPKAVGKMESVWFYSIWSWHYHLWTFRFDFDLWWLARGICPYYCGHPPPLFYNLYCLGLRLMDICKQHVSVHIQHLYRNCNLLCNKAYFLVFTDFSWNTNSND